MGTGDHRRARDTSPRPAPASPPSSACSTRPSCAIIELNGEPGAIGPGDIFVTNDPFYGGVTHLNDVVLAMPVFPGDRLIAWTANIAHWNDVGGMVPGSISTDATEIFQEGLRIPGVKLIAGGRPIESVMRIIEVNSRLPDYLRGDMWAGIAAARVGERRILELVERYGVETFLAALDHFMDYGEQVAKRTLAELPKGTFTLEETQDSGQVYKVTVEITDEEFVVDLRDNPDQDHGPNNASRDGSLVAAQMVFMNLTESHGSANAGHFRRAEAADPPGLGLRPGSPRGVRHVLRGRDPALRPDLALPRAAPRRAPAGRELRLDLRHLHRRAASRHRAALHDRRAAGRRLGSVADERRQPRDVQRLPRRHVQLPGRGRRGPLRAVRRPARAERRAGRGGRAPRRQGDRRRVPGSLERLFLHLRLHAEHPQAVAAGGWARGLAQLRRGDPASTARSSSSRSSPAWRSTRAT